MAIHLHRAERTDRLAVALGELLADPPLDPFTPDLVAVPTAGIERFLTQTLSLRLGTSGAAGRADGVCANVQFPSPARLVEAVLGANPVGGFAPEDDPWRPTRSVWPLLSCIDEASTEPWCRTLARHLGLDGERSDGWDRTSRRFAVASRVASLFHLYGSQRPSLLLDWARGHDTDGAGSPVDADQAWQPQLWRRLRERIGWPSPAERLDEASRAIEGDPGLVDLPQRLSVFGPSRLPADQLRALRALAVGRDVHLWLADPSPQLWSKLSRGAPNSPRLDDTSSALVTHPLLRSLGRDARELGLRLHDLTGQDGTDEHLEPSPAPGSGSRTLLARLQTDLVADRQPQREAADPLAEGDRSVQVHGCHGAGRQVEVLREALLTLLHEDPTLQPRDILVMCPDLATYAPLLAAAFTATGPGTPLADLRVRIADRTPAQDNDVLATLGVILGMVSGRMLRSELLDLMARTPVRTRFRLSDDQLERLESLAESVGVRWGLDAATRAQHGLAGVDTGTWRWGLDRLLLGVALSEEALPVVGEVLPYDDVTSNDVGPIGALADVVGQLIRLRDASVRPAPLQTWIALLSETVTTLMDARGPESWQLSHALGALAGLARSAEGVDSAPELSLADVRWLLGDVLAGRPTRSNFRSGGLTVCGLLPMRSVPHRVICLVGLDDGSFPRSPVPDGDDVLARRPRIGERDPRSEDRQALLDAVLAATEHLVITYTAADDRTNAPSPPCVPLGELLDALDATAVSPDGGRVRERILHRHPLQPFDARSFLPDPHSGRPFSHDAAALAGALAAARPRVPRAPMIPTDPLVADPLDQVEIKAVAGFLAAPAAWFVRTRVGILLSRDPELPSESIPLVVDGLARWSIGDRILDLAGRGGQTPQAIARAERVRGALPPGQLGDATLAEVGPKAADVARGLAEAQGGVPARLVSVALTLPSGRRLLGSVAGVHDHTLITGTFSKADARLLLRVWPGLLALAATDPAARYRAVLVGNDEVVPLAAPSPTEAAGILDELLDLMVSGSSTPLPLYAKTSHAYARRRRDGASAQVAAGLAERCWRSDRFPGENANPDAVAVFGPNAPFAALTAQAPLAGEAWWPDEPRRFGQLSRRLWDPLLAAVARGAQDRLAAHHDGGPA